MHAKRQLLSLFMQRIWARAAFARAAAILAWRIESMRQRAVWHCLPAARGEFELVTREIMRSWRVSVSEWRKKKMGNVLRHHCF